MIASGQNKVGPPSAEVSQLQTKQTGDPLGKALLKTTVLSLAYSYSYMQPYSVYYTTDLIMICIRCNTHGDYITRLLGKKEGGGTLVHYKYTELKD